MNAHNPPASTQTVAQTYMEALHTYGIKYVFANGGTDFAPIIEGILQSRQSGRPLPEFVTVPHENVATAMAQGYYKVSGEMAAVMVHVNVGTANTICGVMNAARDNVPMLLAAGRTPLTESGHAGSRNNNIHWSQENFDQAAIVREHVKWDYELRAGQPVDTIVGRALDIAMTEPRGPVYLTLPRETLGNPTGPAGAQPRRPLGTTMAVPSAAAIEQAADMLAKAENPLIISAHAARDPNCFHALGRIGVEHAIAVATGQYASIASSNPMNIGPLSPALLKAADVVVVVNSPVPWIPRLAETGSNAKLIHIGYDPHFARYPFRGFEMDLALAGDPGAALDMLNEALKVKLAGKKDKVEARRAKNAELRKAFEDRKKAAVEAGRSQRPMTYPWIAHCVNQVKGKNDIVSDELGIGSQFIDIEDPSTYLGTSSGALGMGLGQGLGAKLARPDANVITTVGDGSYMFGVPTAAHFVSQAEKLPVLTMIMNNSQWYAVRRSTTAMYPDGLAAKANSLPIVDLAPSPEYQKIAESCGGYGERVEDPDKVIPALERAFKKLSDGVQVSLNMIVRPREG